jgi:FkbM family methyltransferase
LATSARYGNWPPALSGIIARAHRQSAQLTPGDYASALADFDLHFDQFDLAAHAFALRGFFEWRIAAVASTMLRPGHVVFEGGAQYGTETLYYGWLVDAGGRVVSFEAEPALARRLDREVRRQQMRQCIVVGKALGSAAGTALFERAPEPSVNSGLGSLAPFDLADGAGVKVEVTTLDDAMRAYGPPRLLVMDIQGGELGALRGGLRVLEEARPSMVLEVESASLARTGGSCQEVHELLVQHGYRCWRFTRVGLRSIRAPRPVELGDWLALPEERCRQELGAIRGALVLGAVARPTDPVSPFARARRRRRPLLPIGDDSRADG